jgi:hypothetical protein
VIKQVSVDARVVNANLGWAHGLSGSRDAECQRFRGARSDYLSADCQSDASTTPSTSAPSARMSGTDSLASAGHGGGDGRGGNHDAILCGDELQVDFCVPTGVPVIADRMMSRSSD